MCVTMCVDSLQNSWQNVLNSDLKRFTIHPIWGQTDLLRVKFGNLGVESCK